MHNTLEHRSILSVASIFLKRLIFLYNASEKHAQALVSAVEGLKQ